MTITAIQCHRVTARREDTQIAVVVLWATRSITPFPHCDSSASDIDCATTPSKCTPPGHGRFSHTDISRSGRRPSRPNATANRIRGPQSALTDFLASHNISAQQISTEYQRRVREAQESGDATPTVDEDKENDEQSDAEEDAAEKKKRKRKEEKAILKIKASKEFKRRKAEQSGADDDDVIARGMMAKSQPKPGQFENCDICEKRFTVTPYSKTGPDGGLLCTPCGKEQAQGEKKEQAQAKKRAAPKGKRRQTESDRMMGDVKPGAKSLVEQCVAKTADVVNDIQDFGELPQSLLDRLSQILSKKRVLTSRTLELFLQQGSSRIAIYDSGKLDEGDFVKIFKHMPDLTHVNLRFAGQLKNDALRYMIAHNQKITHLQLGATNLVSDQVWVELFHQQGARLQSLKVSELNDSLNDDTIAEMVAHCPNLQRLKIRSCSHMTEASLRHLSKLTQLQHLSLSVAHDASAETLVHLITSVGSELRTLSLENYPEADDSVIAAIHTTCHQLTKLRFTGSEQCTDAAFTSLFTHWSNPPVPFIDLSNNRDVDNANPDGPEDTPVGFGSTAFAAMMAHSGSLLQTLDIHSDRHISHTTLLDVFNGTTQYPALRDIDMSFVTTVDDVVVRGIFQSCPRLAKLALFACFNARDVLVPRGVAVVGLPNARDNVVVMGDGVMEL